MHSRAGDCIVSDGTSSLADLETSSQQIYAENIPAFCAQSMGGGRDFLIGHDLKRDLAQTSFSKLSDAERARILNDPEFVKSLLSKHVPLQGTTLNQIPNKAIRALEFEAEMGMGIDFYISSLNEFDTHSDSSPLNLLIPKGFAVSQSTASEDFPQYDSMTSLSTFKLATICGHDSSSPKINVECADNLKKLLTWAKPRKISGTPTDIILPELYQKIIHGDDYTAGLEAAARTVAGKFKSENLKHGDSLFADIKEGFLKSGDPVSTAEAKTFEVLGLIATAWARRSEMGPVMQICSGPGPEQQCSLQRVA